jgi:hypothetical protein
MIETQLLLSDRQDSLEQFFRALVAISLAIDTREFILDSLPALHVRRTDFFDSMHRDNGLFREKMIV